MLLRQGGGGARILTQCDLRIPDNYTGIIGQGDETRCANCGKDVEVVYVCPCTDGQCCIRLCMPCRDSRMHHHGMLAHFITAERAGGKLKLRHRKINYRVLVRGDDPNCGHALAQTRESGRQRCVRCGAIMEEAVG